jgi:hypothetical protein
MYDAAVKSHVTCFNVCLVRLLIFRAFAKQYFFAIAFITTLEL